MKLEIQISGRVRTVELHRQGSHLRARIDGRPVAADATEVARGIYSILIEGRAFEVCVVPDSDGLRLQAAGREWSARISDPRAWRGRHTHAVETEGCQTVTAPMPGKVVRVLVKAGDAVEAGQGLLVVEAMKMQNEVKSPRSGRVEKLAVREGQAVNAGDILAIVA